MLRDGWMQTTLLLQPGAPGPGLGGVIGGAQGGVQGGASGGGRARCSGDSEASVRSVKSRKKQVRWGKTDGNLPGLNAHPTSCGVGGVRIAVLELSGSLRHQRWRGGVLRVGQRVAQHHRLSDFCTLDGSFLLFLH